METKLKQLAALSVQLSQQTEEPTVEDWLVLLQLRDDVIEELHSQPAVTEEQKRMLFEVHQLNDILLSRMERQRAETAAELQKLGQTKIQKQAYEQAYSAGSFFIDQRK